MLFKGRVVLVKDDEIVIKKTEYEQLKADSESLKNVYKRIASAIKKTRNDE